MAVTCCTHPVTHTADDPRGTALAVAASDHRSHAARRMLYPHAASACVALLSVRAWASVRTEPAPHPHQSHARHRSDALRQWCSLVVWSRGAQPAVPVQILAAQRVHDLPYGCGLIGIIDAVAVSLRNRSARMCFGHCVARENLRLYYVEGESQRQKLRLAQKYFDLFCGQGEPLMYGCGGDAQPSGRLALREIPQVHEFRRLALR